MVKKKTTSDRESVKTTDNVKATPVGMDRMQRLLSDYNIQYG